MKTGVLLVNLGTPDSPTPDSVGKYLKQFLMDPFVIDIPFLLRWPLVHWRIVPKRKQLSSKQYEKVWGSEGSPLLSYSRSLCEKVRKELENEYEVELGMRYGSPSLRDGLMRLKTKGVTDLIVFPLYPQYSLAATESSLHEIRSCLKEMSWGPRPIDIPAFYSDSHFIDAECAVAENTLKDLSYDMALFSFHGLPERHIRKTDVGDSCVFSEECCRTMTEKNRNCYRAQCFTTAHLIAKRLQIENFRVSFQSRLGRTPWIRPYTDEFYRTLPKEGVRNLVVFCPSFVADCLETLEEVSIRGQEEFFRHGGKSLTLIPSLNDHPEWVGAVTNLVRMQRQAALQ